MLELLVGPKATTRFGIGMTSAPIAGELGTLETTDHDDELDAGTARMVAPPRTAGVVLPFD